MRMMLDYLLLTGRNVIPVVDTADIDVSGLFDVAVPGLDNALGELMSGGTTSPVCVRVTGRTVVPL